MQRTDIILQSINRNGLGIEIGPSHSPIAAKRDGFDVHVIDHMSREGLVDKYQDHGVDLDAIEEVDFVWKGGSYTDLVGQRNHYDWIIASHLIEHTTDLIGFLNDCADLLKDDGVLSLAVPDKRYCFDHFRPITPLSRIIDTHFNQERVHTAGVVAEYFLNVVKKNGQIAWNDNDRGTFEFVHTLDDARNGMESVRKNGAYLDVHAWCFVPSSFRLIIHDLHALGLIPLKEVSFHPTAGFEFFVTLSKRGTDTPAMSRMDLLQAIDQEIVYGIGKHRTAVSASSADPSPTTGTNTSAAISKRSVRLATRIRNKMSRLLR
ncbi:MAG: methyltransferase domain-containing protein [Lautropia sp.]|nr:methyltransferase domain-containing protein [Lautropia sp.]